MILSLGSLENYCKGESNNYAYSSTGEGMITSENDSVMISIDELRETNKKLIDYYYTKEVLDLTNQLVDNLNEEIEYKNEVIVELDKDVRKYKKISLSLGGATGIMLILIILL